MGFWETLLTSIITGGLAGAVVRYVLDARRERIEYTLRLHEEWWKPEFHQMRQAVFELVEDLQSVGGGERSTEFLRQVEQGALLKHPAGPAFARIVFFFADLNACLDKRVVDRRLAYRMFGESQFFWFEPLIIAVREKVKDNQRVRWAWEVNSLSAKFSRIRAKDEARRAKQLLK
jgi:hypothetical protein